MNKRNGVLFTTILLASLLTACGDDDDDDDDDNVEMETITYTVTATADDNGSIEPASATINVDEEATFTVTPNEGYLIDTVTGCGEGVLNVLDNTYLTGGIVADCTVNATFKMKPPAVAATPTLRYTAVKGFTFTWTDVDDASHYRLQENPDGTTGFSPMSAAIAQGVGTVTLTVPLYQRVNGQYILQSCNDGGCTDASPVSVSGTLVDSIGYVKASNTGAEDQLGDAVSLSGDGHTLAVGAIGEDSTADGRPNDNNAEAAGAVYVFSRNGSTWVQQALLKASNAETRDQFGVAVSLSGDGHTLAVGAVAEASNRVDGKIDNSAPGAGAVYVFSRANDTWSEQAYLKASNAEATDGFGVAVSLSGDGHRLAVGAVAEASNRVDGKNDNGAPGAGAVYVFSRANDTWSEQAYLKASNIGAYDGFGDAVSLSGDGRTLAVGAREESSSGTGVGGDQTDNSADEAGAVYVFALEGTWSQQAYIKASNAQEDDAFGIAVSLSDDGDTLAVGATGEASQVTGVDGDQANNNADAAGAVYVFSRDGSTWSEQAYLKASNAGEYSAFGGAISLSDDGRTLAVGAWGEDSNATGVGGDQDDISANEAGAVYVFNRDGSTWLQQAYIKASNAGALDYFGNAVSLSGDGDTLAVGASGEDSQATGIGGYQGDNSASEAGAVYLY